MKCSFATEVFFRKLLMPTLNKFDFFLTFAAFGLSDKVSHWHFYIVNVQGVKVSEALLGVVCHFC